jgi:quercetin dioxygenase-like cupin family protein
MWTSAGHIRRAPNPKGTREMIRTGDTIVNPITGETLIFHQTAADTDGALTLVECIVRPDGFVAGAHVHPTQEERFEVIEGTVGFRAGREKIEAGPGDVVVVPPGTVHRFWNAGDTDARFMCEVRPSLGFEELIETMYGLAQAGRTNRKGLPNPLQLAVIANHHREGLRAPYVPAVLQRMALGMGAMTGRMFGYQPTHEAVVAADAPAGAAPVAEPALVLA